MPKEKTRSQVNSKKNKKNKISKSKEDPVIGLAENSLLKSVGIYERISKVCVGGKKNWRKTKHLIEDVMEGESNFIDQELVPNQYHLDRLLAQNNKLANGVSWFKLHNFFKEKYSVVKNCQIRKQVMKNRGYNWMVDALNILSVQPGLIFRLFERKKVTKLGVYSVWLNFNGKWVQVMIDDFIPVFENKEGKTQFLFSSPHPSYKEIWYILLEKAMAKVYGGYYRLLNGVENYAIRDLTGAPCNMFDIVHIKKGKDLTKREQEHVQSFWEKLVVGLKKGYLLSLIPREPTQLEEVEKKSLNIANKKYYMSNGLYSGHSYAVVSTQEVIGSDGKTYNIVKLRNPWINEKWEGEWSISSKLWTENLRRKLNYPKEQNDLNEFWIKIEDLMGYFECMNVYKTIPGNIFNQIDVKFNEKRFARTVIRVSVPSKGKYTFSVDQKDLRIYESQNLKYAAIKLTLGKISKDGVILLSHTSSKKLRNTFVRKSLDSGEYYLLIERENFQENINLMKNNQKLFEPFNTLCVSSYGPKTCFMKIAEDPTVGDTIFNYLCYYGWKSYSMKRIGKKMSEFKVNFYDQSWNQMALYLLNIPDCIIYAFKNPNDFGVELKSQIAGITNKEIVGPEGRVSFRQDFSMNPGENDIFILRDTEKNEIQDQPVNHKFQITSVVGRKFFENKLLGKSYDKVYEFLLGEKGKRKVTEIEKDEKMAKKVGLFDLKTKEKIIEKFDDLDIVKKKQIINPMKKEEYEDIIDMEEVERKEKEVQVDKQRREREEQERLARERERLLKEEEEVRREFERKNGITKPENKVETEQHSTEESMNNNELDKVK